MPKEFVIGRHTFFDFGPPHDFYEVFVVRPAGNGAAVDRITLTPVAVACYLPAKVEAATATLDESVESLLGSSNPCAIPEKELRRELKRCKHCSVFSGANVTMQVSCGALTRLIRSNVLEQDWFEAHPNTPKNTFWTMKLLGRLDQAMGPGVMEKPMFPISQDGPEEQMALDPAIRKILEDGGYDALFPGAPDKASDLFRTAQIEQPKPAVRLKSVFPAHPEPLDLPSYPLIARLARVHGTVEVSGIIGPTGTPTLLAVESGPPLLRRIATNAVSQWRFPAEDSGQLMHAMIYFDLNCPAANKPSN